MAKARKKTPVDPQDSIFVPERSPPPPYRQASVPKEDMVSHDSPSMPTAKKTNNEDTAKNGDVTNLVLRLRMIETNGRKEFDYWDANPHALTRSSSVIPSKRKGMRLIL